MLSGVTLQVLCGPELDLATGSCSAYLLGAEISAKYDQLMKNSTPGACAGCANDCRCVDINKDWSCFPGDAEVNQTREFPAFKSFLLAPDSCQYSNPCKTRETHA